MMRSGLDRPCLCLVTDRDRTASGDIVATVCAALSGGVGMVQLREKDLPASHLLNLARRLRKATAGKALLVVNDRVDIAMMAAADGVQLGENALDVTSVRRLVGPDMLIGRSVHSAVGAVQAESAGADFLVLGTLFETASHPGARTGGLGLVREVTGSVRIPVLGIGGVTSENAGEVIAAGADGAAAITAITMAPNPAAAVRDFMSPMRHAYMGREGMTLNDV